MLMQKRKTPLSIPEDGVVDILSTFDGAKLVIFSNNES